MKNKVLNFIKRLSTFFALGFVLTVAVIGFLPVGLWYVFTGVDLTGPAELWLKRKGL